MIIQLPNGEKKELDDNKVLSDKLKIVDNLVEKWIDEICNRRESDTIIYFLDGLANYLVWHKETDEKNKEDKDILSVEKIKKMIGKRQSKSIPFSSLSKQQKELLFDEVRSVNDER